MQRESRLFAHMVTAWTALSGLLLFAVVGVAPLRAQSLLDPATLTKYLDALPNPLDNVIAPIGTLDGAPYYEVEMTQFAQQLHSQLSPTTVWGYNGTYPGPTFNVQRNQPVKVKWTNNLVDGNGQPLSHLLPYDSTVHGAGPQYPEVRTVAHLHGGVVEPQSDGFPEHWFSAAPNAPANGMGGPAGNSALYTYHNGQPSSTLWYHDHGMGITRLNVYAGLAGFYLVRDADEAALNLPGGNYEVPLVLQDRSFYDNGQLFYPRGPGDLTDPGGPDPLAGLPPEFTEDASVVPHFFGNTNLVNGKVWPVLEVEPRKYRFRVLNGSNSRFYDLQLDADSAGALTFHQIGSDGGLLEARTDRDQMLMSPGQRADVIVDFSGLSVGDEVILRNFAPDSPFEFPGAGHTPADPNTTGQVMKFQIVAATGPDNSSLPQSLVPVPRIQESDAVVTRQLSLVEDVDEFGRPKLLLDGAKWTDPLTELPVKGTTEVWEITNSTPTSHPIHLHLVQFQVLDRVSRQLGEIPLEPHELGWMDTVMVNRRETVRVIARFEDFEGLYVWHCHILEHEDHEMMRPYEVVPGPELVVEQGVTLALDAAHTTPAGYTLTVEGILDTSQLDVVGVLRGTGQVQSNVINHGVVSPGVDEIGDLTIAGDYTNLASATLTLEVAGAASHDALVVTGTTTLGGTLSLKKDTEYTPALGETQVLLTSAGGVSNAFATIDGMVLSDLLGFAVRYPGNSVEARTSVRGDTDFDDDVDITDFNTLATNFDPGGANGPHPWVHANFDGDGDVDITDFNTLATNFNPAGYDNPATAIAAPAADPGTIDLIVDLATGEVVLDGNAASISGVQVYSAGGGLVAADLTPEVLQFVISTNATTYAEGAFANVPVIGIVSLGALYDVAAQASDLAFEYTMIGQPTVQGTVIYVPEPGSASLLLIGLVGLLVRRRRLEMKRPTSTCLGLGLLCSTMFMFVASVARGTTVTLQPSKDNTLVDKSDGSLSNGEGKYLFAGRIDKDSENLRRALLAFDIAGNVPAGSVIQSASLTLRMSRSKVRAMTFDLHRVTADWGEGASNADGEEGVGTSAEPGDATWLHTFYDGSFWANAGGDFDATISGSRSVDKDGFYTWGSTAQMVADVQGWLDTPSSNFGWLLKGPENKRSAKRFDSRENNDLARRPALMIEFVSGGPETFNWVGTGSGGSFHDNANWDTNQAPSSPTDIVNLVNTELTDQVATISNNMTIDDLTINGNSKQMTLSVGQGLTANVGELQIGSLGGLGVELATGGSAALNAAGPATLSGRLALSTSSTPAPTDSFEIVSYASRTGLFDTITGQNIEPGRSFSLHYNDSRVLAVAGEWAAGGEPLAGDVDVNQELLVSGAWSWNDTLIKRGTGELILDLDGGFSAGASATLAIVEGTVRLQGTAQTLTLGNLSYGDLQALSGDSTFAGLNGWYGNVTVPEPNGLVLVAAGLVAWGFGRWRNRTVQ